MIDRDSCLFWWWPFAWSSILEKPTLSRNHIYIAIFIVAFPVIVLTSALPCALRYNFAVCSTCLQNHNFARQRRYTHMRTHMHARTHTRPHTHLHSEIHVHTVTRMHARARAHTHTHTDIIWWKPCPGCHILFPQSTPDPSQPASQDQTSGSMMAQTSTQAGTARSTTASTASTDTGNTVRSTTSTDSMATTSSRNSSVMFTGTNSQMCFCVTL